MSTPPNTSHDSRKNSGNRTYTSLLDVNGSFDVTFRKNQKTNRAGSGSDEDAWSTATNTSDLSESKASRDDSGSANNGQIKKAKRKA